MATKRATRTTAKRKAARSADIEDLAAPTGAKAAANCGANDGAELPEVSRSMRHAAAFHDFDLKELRVVRENLLEWYDAYRRKLPWRGDPPPYLTTATHTKQKAEGAGSRGKMDAFVQPKAEEFDTPEVEPEEKLEQQRQPRKVTPYETWVSEIMLQQTRVDTVVEYFTRWIDKFPTVTALAEASEEEVNALWAGLGYYRRARMLHSGAKYVVENLDGELPSSVDQLLTIPGIGPYTAGAIASIAFGHRAPLVDGNVIRVIARLRAVGADPKNKELIKLSWKEAGELVEECDRPGALNQAIMELGATICTVQNPQCSQCPVRGTCLAYEEARTTESLTRSSDEIKIEDECTICDRSRLSEWDNSIRDASKYPLKAKKNDSKNEAIAVTVVSCPHDSDQSDGDSDTWRYLMSRRPAGGLLAGQWEFLHTKVSDGDVIPAYAQRKKLATPRLEELLGKRAISAANATRKDLGELTHIFSHVKHHMGIEHVHLSSSPSESLATSNKDEKELRWMTTDEMKAQGITTGVKKILQLVCKPPSSTKRRAKSSTSPHVAGAKRAKSIAQFFTKL